MSGADVRDAIERGLIWAVTFLTADEIERVRANAARRQRLATES